MTTAKKTFFNQRWLLDNLHNEEWKYIKEVESNPNVAFCKLCSKSFSLSNMGKRAISSHFEGKQHKARLKIMKTSATMNKYVQQQNKDVTNSDVVAASLLEAKDETNRDQLVHNSNPMMNNSNSFDSKIDLAKAEILWALNMIVTHTSYRTASKSIDIMRSMFQDSPIAQNITFGKTKAAYLVLFGLAPYFENLIEKYLKTSKYYVVCFDESLNKVAQKGQMDICVRYWDESDNEVKCTYYTSVFIEGRATAENLLSHFKNSIEPAMKIGKILQISMDGPNVNWKFLELLKENEDCNLLELGSCGLHVLHGALQSGHKACKWDIDSILRGMYWLFKDSPARRADFIKITGKL